MKQLSSLLLVVLIVLSIAGASTPLFQANFQNYASGASSGFTYSIFAVSGSANVAPNESVSIRGTVCPNPMIGILEGVGAQVTYIRPDGSNFTDGSLAVTSSNFNYCSGGDEGSDYIDTITPDMEGVWHVVSIAYWSYDNGTQVQLQSNEISFTVAPAGPSSSVLVISGIVAAIVVGVASILLLKKFRGARGLPPPPPN